MAMLTCSIYHLKLQVCVCVIHRSPLEAHLEDFWEAVTEHRMLAHTQEAHLTGAQAPSSQHLPKLAVPKAQIVLGLAGIPCKLDPKPVCTACMHCVLP